MNKITTFALLFLVASMTIGGITNSAFAQTDPTILLTLAKRAESQIHNQISEDSSEKAKQLFRQGQEEVRALEKALAEEDIQSAKEHFLMAMRIFTQISHLQTDKPTDEASTSKLRAPQNDYSSDLERIHKYVTSLKTLAKKYNAPINFEKLDGLFASATEQIRSNQIGELKETINQIKQLVVEINNEIRDFASKQQQTRAKQYAQQYIGQLDRLIENAKNQGVDDEIIDRLESARERLSSASDPQDIITQIKQIISIKKQFELTKNDRFESRVMQVEKNLVRLSNTQGVDSDKIEEAKQMFEQIKQLLRDGQIDSANELLRELNSSLIEISKSLRLS